MKGKNIIVTGLQPWDIEIGSNCKNIAIEFSKQNKVLYVNSPLDRNTINTKKDDPRIAKRIRIKNGEESCFEKISDSLTVFYPRIVLESLNILPFYWLFSLFNKKNNKLFASEIQFAANELKMNNFVHFNDSDMFRSFYLKELLNPDLSIYYIRDNLIKNPYWRKHGQYTEPLLIKKSDLTVTNSLYYADYAKLYNHHSYMVGQGCDVSMYDDSIHNFLIAEELKNITHPIIGYVGFLSSRRLDIDLIRMLATKKPEWTIVLVGPEDDTFKQSDLHSKSNIIFTGSKSVEELPNFIKGFDICINPQILNDATIGNYPRKIDEYLAMGKPTIATWTKAMEYFADVTYLAKESNDYITLISKALEENSEKLQEARKQVAKTHTWENNVNEIYKCIELI